MGKNKKKCTVKKRNTDVVQFASMRADYFKEMRSLEGGAKVVSGANKGAVGGFLG